MLKVSLPFLEPISHIGIDDRPVVVLLFLQAGGVVARNPVSALPFVQQFFYTVQKSPFSKGIDLKKYRLAAAGGNGGQE